MSELPISSATTGEPHTDSIEVELTGEDLWRQHATEPQASSSDALLTQTLATAPELRTTSPAPRRAHIPRRAKHVTGALATLFAFMVLRSITEYEGLIEIQPHDAGKPLASTLQSIPDKPQQPGTPVRMANPFDSSEVFEFPPGTSTAEARESVASLLLQRARDRRPQWGAVKRKPRQPVSGDTSAS